MKYLRIIVPLLIVILVVSVTEVLHLTGIWMILLWVVGFLAAMISAAIFEVKIRLKRFNEENKAEKEEV